jgi:hypothetical protein
LGWNNANRYRSSDHRALAAKRFFRHLLSLPRPRRHVSGGPARGLRPEGRGQGLQLLLHEEPLAVVIAEAILGDRGSFRSGSVDHPDATQMFEPFPNDPHAPPTQLGSSMC